jgi:hypothetical protein
MAAPAHPKIAAIATPAVINVKDFMNFPGKSLGCIRTTIVSHAA